MEKIEIIEMFVKVQGEFVGVKFYKVLVPEAGVQSYYEYHLQKHFQLKGSVEPKKLGETFCGKDMDALMCRLISYVNELNYIGVEKSVTNDKY